MSISAIHRRSFVLNEDTQPCICTRASLEEVPSTLNHFCGAGSYLGRPFQQNKKKGHAAAGPGGRALAHGQDDQIRWRRSRALRRQTQGAMQLLGPPQRPMAVSICVSLLTRISRSRSQSPIWTIDRPKSRHSSTTHSQSSTESQIDSVFGRRPTEALRYSPRSSSSRASPRSPTSAGPRTSRLHGTFPRASPSG